MRALKKTLKQKTLKQTDAMIYYLIDIPDLLPSLLNTKNANNQIFRGCAPTHMVCYIESSVNGFSER